MKKYLSGTVVTNAAKDTSVVEIKSWKTHRIFRKRYQVKSRYLVQNKDNVAQIGQTVTIAPCRPISKLKSWTIVEDTATEIKPAKKTTAKSGRSKKESS